MSIKIPIPVLWDSDNNFLNSNIVSVDASSVVIGTVPKPQKIYPPQAVPVLVNTLEIKEPNFGGLYLNVPLAVWQAAIRAASGTPAPLVQTRIYTINSTQAGSNTITDAALAGITIIAIWQNGQELNPTTIIYAGSSLTFPASSLGIGDTVGVIFYYN